MAMNGIGIIPLIELLQKPNVTQKWYADDGNAAGDLKSLRAILDNVDVHGFRVLGSVIGTPSACDKYIESEIEKTATLTEKLSKIAKTSPQNAYFCYTKGVQTIFRFLFRTTPEAFKKKDEIEKNVRQQYFLVLLVKTI